MNELHTNEYGPRELLCSNSSNKILSKETLEALEELGDVLRVIHKRIVFEGYEIVNGVIRKKTARDVNVYEKV